MKLLVHARSLAGGGRLPNAARALARRGHPVAWLPAAKDADLLRVARLEADVVLAGTASPVRTALLARLVRARVLLLELGPGHSGAWAAGRWWAVGSGYVAALVEPADAASARSADHGLPLDRIALWPDGPPADSADPDHADAEVLERACERALRRQRGRAPVPAVFLDRDGTLVAERGYLTDPADIELLPGVSDALRRLSAAGFLLVVISNQSGVGRGFFSAATVHAAMARLREALRRHDVELDAVYFCPHRPEAGCSCRKPGTGLLRRAEEDLVLSLAHSVMVGDKLLDAETGRRAGGRGLLVRTGYGRDEERRLSGGDLEWPPDAVVDDLGAAAEWVIRHPGASPID